MSLVVYNISDFIVLDIINIGVIMFKDINDINVINNNGETIMNYVFKGVMWGAKLLIGKLGKSLVAIIMSCASEEFMQWAVLDLATRVVKSTENTTDDVWIGKIKEGL